MTNVEKSEILHIWHVCDVENVTIYAQKYICGEKMTNMRSDLEVPIEHDLIGTRRVSHL